jgi:hypothetical protein
MISNYFDYEHLPERLQPFSKPIAEAAEKIASQFAEGNDSLPCSKITSYESQQQYQLGMQKLIEAKDCFVRAALDL